MKAFLILGTNLGFRRENLRRAEILIERFVGKILKRSSIIETKPFGVLNQPYFLNYGLLVETIHPPFELLRLLKWIEKRVGRYKTYRWGPRVIDIDIVALEGLEISTTDLTVPHPGLKDRVFFKKLGEEVLHENFFFRCYF